MQNLLGGLAALGSLHAVIWLILGALIGVVVGVIPGLSTAVILTIILIFAPSLSLTAGLCLFLGAVCGSFYSASIAAILINAPPHPEAYPITLDGYPMARQGRPGRALGISACSTLVGGIIGCAVLVAFLPLMSALNNVLHPPEYIALVTLAMVLVGSLSAESVGKAICSTGVGLMLASIGPSPITGTFRFTFGATGLISGLSLVAVAVGVFAIPQMVILFGTGTASAREDLTGKVITDSAPPGEMSHSFRDLMGGVLETFRHPGVLVQSGLVGGITGMIPGIGGFAGNYMAYGIARQTSRRRTLFGTGIPEGIIAPEGSSLAKEAGHIVPIIGLGIPGGVSGALFIGLLAINGMKTGSGFETAYPHVTGEIVWIIALSCLIGTVAGMLVGPQLARAVGVPGPLLLPFVFTICVAGAYLTDTTFTPAVEVVIFGIFGLGMRRLGYSLGSFILGIVLAPTLEANIYLTHNIYPGFSFLGQRPIADVLFGLAALVLISTAISQRATAKASKKGNLSMLPGRNKRQGAERYVVLAPLMSTFLLAVSVFWVVYSLTHYNFPTGAMPVIGGIATAAASLLALPGDLYRLRRHWMTRGDTTQAARADGGPGSEVTPDAGRPDDAASGAPDQLGPRELSPPLGIAAVTAVAPATVAEPVDVDAAPTAASIRDRVLLGAPTRTAPIRLASWARNGQYRREVIAFAWLAGLVAGSWLIGFTISSVIFAVLYGLLSTARHFRTIYHQLAFTVLSAAAIGLVVHGLFQLTGVTFYPYLNL
jgi:putative tricarboxylic transport membrane protein